MYPHLFALSHDDGWRDALLVFFVVERRDTMEGVVLWMGEGKEMERRWCGCRSRKSVQAKSLVFFGDIFDASVDCGAVLCLDRRTSERQASGETVRK